MITEKNLNVNCEDYGLLTDLYQLTMTACYAGEGIAHKKACFELFVRSLPDNYGYLVAMGLEQVIDYLQNLSFSANRIKYLQNTGIFDNATSEFWQLLEQAQFTGDLWAVPEGTVIFPNEPFLRIEAPLWQGQIIETYLLNTINYQSLIATKASRMRQVAGKEALLLEFGTRRAFSPQASIWAARAAIAGGFNATSNVLAGMKLGVKPAGTMAHALVMAISALSGSEEDAFRAFHRYFPQSSLLIDTYDTMKATAKLKVLEEQENIKVLGVRIDSGDLGKLAGEVKEILPKTNIFVSGDLDEFTINQLRQKNQSISGYGIGTKLVTGNNLGGVYKLVEIEGIPTCKKSKNKATYPSKKQIFRSQNQDRLGLSTEYLEDGERGLLELFIKNGRQVKDCVNLLELQKEVEKNVDSLPEKVKNIDNPIEYPVYISSALNQLQQKI